MVMKQVAEIAQRMRRFLLTLQELAKLIRHYWLVVCLIPIGCVLAVILAPASLFTTQYEATATLSVNDPSGSLTLDQLMSTAAPIAVQEANEATNEGVSVEVSYPKSNATAAETHILTFVATGKNAEQCMSAANEAAFVSENRAKETFLHLQDEYNTKQEEKIGQILEALDESGPNLDTIMNAIFPRRDYTFCTLTVKEATSAISSGKSKNEVVPIALFAGLIISICVVVVIDSVKSPLKSGDQLEKIFDAPLLTLRSGEKGSERLWSNLGFVLGAEPSSLALIPLKETSTATNLANSVVAAIRAEGGKALVELPQEFLGEDVDDAQADVSIVPCAPVEESVKSLHCARKACAVVVCATQWSDSKLEAQRVAREFALAKISVSGVVLLAKAR